MSSANRKAGSPVKVNWESDLHYVKTEYLQTRYGKANRRPLQISELGSTTSLFPKFEAYLRRSIQSNLYPLYYIHQIKTGSNRASFWVATSGDEISGALMRYQIQLPKLESAWLIGTREAATELTKKIDFEIGVIVSGGELSPVVEEKFRVTGKYEMDLMITDQSKARLVDDQRVRKIDSSRAEDWAELAISSEFGEESLPKVPGERELSLARDFLERNQCFGIYLDDELVSRAAIIMRFPEAWSVGVVYTKPKYRGLGLATSVTSAAVREALAHIDRVMLYVRHSNQAAISAYKKIGFETVSSAISFDLGTGIVP